MSLRDESFRKLLGREPTPTEWADINALQHATGLNPNDASWGLFAFLATCAPSAVENRERLQVTVASLEDYGRRIEDFDRRLKEALVRLPDGGANTDTGAFWDELGSTVASSVSRAVADWTPRSSLRDWLGDQVNAARATAGGLVITLLLGMVVACWAGYHTAQQADAARQAMIDAHARTVAAWTKTPEGQHVYAWARLNATGLRALLTCGYPGWRRESQDGYTVCYPNGGGHGYYLTAR